MQVSPETIRADRRPAPGTPGFLAARSGRAIPFVTEPFGSLALGLLPLQALPWCKYHEKTTGRSAVGPRPAQLPGGPVEQGNPFASQQFRRLTLGLLPGRDRLLDQPPALCREPEGL